jgi:hypothetical protein
VRTLLAVMLIASPLAAAQERRWEFRATLDDKPLGYHRFVLRELSGERHGEREMVSSARFEVRFLGFVVYRYAHDAIERWKGDCLTSLKALTDDNGERSTVELAPRACAMTFAYWNPKILERAELWNAQTGKPEKVQVEALGADGIPVRGETLIARRYRLSGARHPIELWYSAQGEWLALESRLDQGRLRYRLERQTP